MQRTNYPPATKWEEYGRAYVVVFGNIKPCNTMVEVSALINPAYLIQIEACAILNS